METQGSHRILLAVDDSEASVRAVSYVGRFLTGITDPHILLLHLLPPLPPGLLEHGGGRNKEEEEEIETAQEAEQAEWIQGATQKAQPLLESARASLLEHGLPESTIEVRSVPTVPVDQAVNLILREAGAFRCDTIVVGRGSLTWLRELFHRHIGQELASKAEAFTTVIVG